VTHCGTGVQRDLTSAQAAAAERRVQQAATQTIIIRDALVRGHSFCSWQAVPRRCLDVPGGNPATWHDWLDGLVFLLIIATCVLAPLMMVLAVRGVPSWRPIAIVSLAATALLLYVLVAKIWIAILAEIR
jgi:hypothetical protein